MTKQLVQIMMAVVLAASGVVFISGCQNDAMTGGAIGSLAGAGIGQLAGGDTEATLIGAAVGAGAGYILGNESEREKSNTQMRNMRQEMNTRIVKVTNSNDSVILVRLRRRGVGWVGTAGEYYSALPTSEQLRPVYGF
jgi:uncharacterized protein YcfJ